MVHFRKMHYRRENKGFTLIELLISLVISGFILTAIYNILISNNKIYIRQNDLVNMEQDLRSAINIMAREIRMAGYSPNATYNVGLNSTSSSKISFSFYNDSYQNSTTIVYEIYDSSTYGDNTLGRSVNGNKQPIIQNVSNIGFSYDNCKVVIYLQVSPKHTNLNIPDLNMTKSVFVRNMCLN